MMRISRLAWLLCGFCAAAAAPSNAECDSRAGERDARPYRADAVGSRVPRDRTNVVRFVPKGEIFLPDADVRLAATVFYPGWTARTPNGGLFPEADGSRRWWIADKGNAATNFVGRTAATLAADGSLDVSVALETVAPEVRPIGSAVCARLPVARYAGGKVVLDGGAEKPLPAVYEKGQGLVFRETVSDLAVYGKDGRLAFALRFPQPTECRLQDNREWKGDSCRFFALRICIDGKGRAPRLVRGDAFALDFNVRLPGPVVHSGRECVIEAGGDWVPLKAMNDPAPGSALDFSSVAPHDAPAGKHGWLVVRGGHFEFEDLPGVEQRFYGVNFVSDANVPPVAEAERFVANLARVGYNAVRFHHHDGRLADGRGELKPEAMERFDAMVAACIRHGVYITTDLYVSRKVAWRDMGIDKPGVASVHEFKTLVATHEGAFSNFLNYARNFLSHVNPHTGRRYADEPAMPLLSLVNEGGDAKKLTPADERDFARRVTRFVREELKSRVLLTNMNSFHRYSAAYDEVRANELDYADDHFYVDHPKYPVRKKRLPVELANANPIRRRDWRGLFGLLDDFRRMGKAMPFVVSEYNFAGPGAFRGFGGLETGAIAAREGVDGLWRFAWSHGLAGVSGPRAMNSFDMSGDPLTLAGERAALCLFLRGDLKAGDPDALAIDAETGSLRVVTDRTCGGFAESGTIRAGRLEARLRDAPATVWASALDAEPLATSRRILVCHLTDVQNTGAAFADFSRTMLLRWGDLPHLMRKGRAGVVLAVAPGDWKVYALDCAGNRRGEVPSRWKDGRLAFVADVARDPSDATMSYELAR